MNRLKLFIFSILAFGWAFASQAQVNRITANVALTNVAFGTSNYMTITVNGNVRTWTNNVVVPSQQILTNSTPTGSKTNMFDQFGANPFPQVIEIDTGPTNIALIGNSGTTLTVTVSTNWATVSYSTQAVTSMLEVRVPIAGEATGGQATNIASLVVKGQNDLSTNSFYENAITVQNLLGNTNTQLSVVGIKGFTNVAGQWWGIVSNSPAISGTLSMLTNGFWTGGALLSPTLTNGQNFGNPFRSPGAGVSSEQFGVSANASGAHSAAFGASATATDSSASGFGFGATAGSVNTTAIGASTTANTTNASAFGVGAQATANNALAVGFSTVAANSNSTAVGASATTTANNQIRLGTSAETVSVPGMLDVRSNATFSGSVTVTNSLTATNGTLATEVLILPTVTNSLHYGTNSFPAGGDIAFGRYALSTLANGNNAGIVVGTNVFVEVSGPSSAFTVNGIAGGRDGKYLILLNQTGQNMTIANQSGVDATAANRVICLTGADKAVTGNSAAMLIYSGNASRWILLYFGQ